jgi:hypothetical protein
MPTHQEKLEKPVEQPLQHGLPSERPLEGVKLVLRVQTSPLGEMMLTCRRFPHANKMTTLTHSPENITIYVTEIARRRVPYLE